MQNLPPVLYAEDNENDIELTLQAFKICKLQNRVDVAKNGQEVLNYLNYKEGYEKRAKEKPILILLDIKMPKVDGLAVLREIKNNPEFKLIPVVMLTASAIENDLIDSYKLGANAYVIKPIDFTEFLDAIKKIVNFWISVNKTA